MTEPLSPHVVQMLLDEVPTYTERYEKEQAKQVGEAEPPPYGRLAALIEAAFLVTSTDGRISSLEHVGTLENVGRLLQGDKRLQPLMSMLLAHARQRVLAEGVDARLSAIASALEAPELRRAALAVASAAAMSDRVLQPKEYASLEGLAKALGVSEEELHGFLRSGRPAG